MKAALWNAKIPLVKNVTIDGNNVDMNVSENLNDCIKLDVSAAPLLVSYYYKLQIITNL